jgi:hypothetical protein
MARVTVRAAGEEAVVDYETASAPWSPARLGFIDRPTGADYVAIETLGVPLTGVGIRQAAAHPAAAGKVLTLPAGVFEFVDYAQGDGAKFMHGLMVNLDVTPRCIRGIVGSGAGTVLQMAANSSHFNASTVLTGGTSTGAQQALVSTVQFYRVNDVEFGNLTVQGTPQPGEHYNHGVRINGDNAWVHHVRFAGAARGGGNSPPGETYALMVAGRDPVIEDCELDGRRSPSSAPVGSTLIGGLGCTNFVARRVYAHDMLSGFGAVQWEGSGWTTEDFWVARPGTGTGGMNGCHTNHEMNKGGPIKHIRPHIDLDAWYGPTDGRPRRTSGKFPHFVLMQATGASTPDAYSAMQIIDPVHDSWGGVKGGFAIARDAAVTSLPTVTRGGVTLTPVIRAKWWEDKPAFDPAKNYWVAGLSGDASTWG